MQRRATIGLVLRMTVWTQNAAAIALLTFAGLCPQSLLSPALAEARDGTAFGYCHDDIKAGWNFYCKPPVEPEEEPLAEPVMPPPAPPAPPPAAEKTYTEQIEEFRKALDEMKYRAILDPTEENVQSYMEAQQRMTGMATAFTDQWQRVLFKTPALDINTRFPISQMGGAVYQDQMRVARENSLIEAAANLGFMVIVEDPAICGLCTPQLEVIQRLQASHGIEVIVVSADGSFQPAWPNAVVDTGQLRAYGLTDSPRPTVALIEPRTGIVEPIGSGLLTEDVILERVHVVTKVPVGERY
ncbi:conjugal transfer protein TraF [Pseudomonas sp. GX19020]|uniref:conjugal transfer protein TraF n=1 Tax=Pseudomonas sp. GX19020 TaxID=2942277 RepID=UPI002019E33F|nr:conjugal transfer protein TraF [Pseudomonas sp. GX19020]